MQDFKEFEAIIKRIMEHTEINRDELMDRIRKKYTELSIITLEGAAKMVAKELGIKNVD